MNSGGFKKKDETKNEVTLHAKPPNTKKSYFRRQHDLSPEKEKASQII